MEFSGSLNNIRPDMLNIPLETAYQMFDAGLPPEHKPGELCLTDYEVIFPKANLVENRPWIANIVGTPSAGKSSILKTLRMLRPHGGVNPFHVLDEINLRSGLGVDVSLATFEIEFRALEVIYGEAMKEGRYRGIIAERGLCDVLGILQGHHHNTFDIARLERPLRASVLPDILIMVCADQDRAVRQRSLSTDRPVSSNYMHSEYYDNWLRSYDWLRLYYHNFLEPLGMGLLMINPDLATVEEKANLVRKYLEYSEMLMKQKIKGVEVDSDCWLEEMRQLNVVREGPFVNEV